MSVFLSQGRLLRERRRFAEAKAAIRQHLAIAPNDFAGHFELAVTGWMEGTDHRAALADIERAIGLDPENPAAHCVRSSILNALDRHQEALAAADEARGLDPENAFAWECRAHALLDMRRLPEAEEAARQSLALDPMDESASNLLSTILRLQQRFDEAEVEIERHLARDPENAWTFATAGWTALNRGDRKQAEDLFREALRLDPEMEHARIGLREAYKARSLFYRLYLRWVFFMQRHSAQNRWLIVIGLYLGFRFGRTILASIHPLAAAPLVVAYLLLVFGSWLASGLGHFLLLEDRVARLSLTKGEKLDGAVVGGLFVVGIALLGVGFGIYDPGITFIGGTMMAASIPAGMIFDNPSPKGRWTFASLAIAILFFGGSAAYLTITAAPDLPVDPRVSRFLNIGAVGLIASTWLHMIPGLTNAPPR